MRIRSWMFVLVSLSLFCIGCGDKQPETPPPGASDVDTPAVDVDPGEAATGDETEEGDETKE